MLLYNLPGVVPTTLVGYAGVVLAVAGLLVFYQALYNIYLHPLSSFPGPTAAAVTRLYYIKYLLTGRLPFNNLKLHKKYGGIVRVAPNELSLNTAEGWKDIYGNRVGKPEMPKNALFYATTSSGSVGLFGSTRERHGPLRRLVSHGFSEKALREQEPLLQEYIDLLMKRLYQHCKDGTEMVDMVQWYNFFTFDVIGDLAFGEPFDCLASGVYHPWVAAIFENVKASSWLRAIGYYPWLGWAVKPLMPKSLKERRAQHHRMTLAKVHARQQRKTERADFLARFVEKDADASEAETVATARTLIIAGSETTATLLSGVTYLLLKHPAVLNKLVDEVRSAFDSESDIRLVEVNKLAYMLACLDEAMRMYPPVPGSFPRDVPAGGDRIGDRYVPESVGTPNAVQHYANKAHVMQTIVAVTQFATYHSETNFHLPDDFIPERWLGDERFVNDNKAAFQPFSTGPRNCVGQNLAYVEMRLVLARLLWSFDLKKLDPRSENWTNQNVYLLWEKPPLFVQLDPVKKEKPEWAK